MSQRLQQVPLIPTEHIEREALVLLEQFGHSRGLKLAPPIPVDAILEIDLKLSLDFDDLHGIFGVPVGPDGRDLLGAIRFDDRAVFVDQALDPTDHPDQEGRYRFTLAHEVGHWILHRELVMSRAKQGDLLAESDGDVEPMILCRSSERAERVEHQANEFAAQLLMPREMVRGAWKARHGNAPSRRVSGLDGTVQSEPGLSPSCIFCCFELLVEGRRPDGHVPTTL